MTEVRDMVEVWCDSTGRWVPGFELRERRSDGSVVVGRPGGPTLPEAFTAARVRPDEARRA